MSSIKEKERFKEQQEKFQAVLSALLKDEDNKYCVDCDAKGPRWAAWNLGVFLCIRCAGIHRNLGVHISKVKSVNLDSWTPEQVAMMQEMGNSRARAVYEANIPDGFRRPQTDSSLEAFIRSKYEQKKYIAREWIPPQPRVPKEWLEDPKAEKKRARAKQASSTIQLTNVPKTTNKPVSPAEETAKPAQAQKVEVKAPAANSASSDLLGLDLGSSHTNDQQAAAPVQPSGGNELLDLFVAPQSGQAPANTAPAPAAGSDLMNGASDGSLFGEEKGEEKKTSAKDSIMALYGGGGGGGGVSQPQMYGVPAAQPNMSGSNLNPAVSMNGSDDLMKLRDNMNNPFMMPQQPFAQAVPNSSMPFSQSQFMAHPSFSQSNPAFNSAASQHPAFSQPSASFATLTNQQPSISHSAGLFGDLTSQMAHATSTKAGQFPVFSQSTVNGFHQKTAPIVSTSQAPSSVATFASPSTQSQSFLGAPGPLMEAQGLGQSRGPNPSWGLFNQPQASCYGNQGGVYMPQAQQQMYPGMTGQQQGMMGPQGMMGAQGMRPQQGMVGAQQGMVGQQQGMVGQQHGMVGQQQGMMGTQQGMMGMMGQQGMMGQPQGMMGQPQGMMGNQGMNGAQMGMYNGQMMSGNPGMYAPQQMQQLQFQQMQQQMTNLKLNGAQMGTMPQQTTSGASGWGNTGQGQTLATNLWQ